MSRTDGIQLTVDFESPSGCPVATAANECGSTVTRVGCAVSSNDGTGGVSEYRSADSLLDVDGLRKSFSRGSVSWYRLDHASVSDCPCQYLGDHGCPITDYRVADGTLTLVFHVPDFESVRSVVTDLRERFSSINVRRMLRSPQNGDRDTVLVDRARLTDRQRQVLETAYDMGYFERPRRATATDVAEALGVSPSTFSEHLSIAERKLLEDVV